MTDKTMRFELELPERRLPLVEADLHWLKRAVHNYLSNAAKYTPEGSTIILRAYEENRFVHIEVADNGPGIPPQAIPRLFERFYRVDDGSRVTGTGLGLAIVKSVAEAHGGTVYVRSTPGEGSTFGLTIPAKKPARGDAWRRRPAP
jgi:signal transduction histidine kinase